MPRTIDRQPKYQKLGASSGGRANPHKDHELRPLEVAPSELGIDLHEFVVVRGGEREDASVDFGDRGAAPARLFRQRAIRSIHARHSPEARNPEQIERLGTLGLAEGAEAQHGLVRSIERERPLSKELDGLRGLPGQELEAHELAHLGGLGRLCREERRDRGDEEHHSALPR